MTQAQGRHRLPFAFGVSLLQFARFLALWLALSPTKYFHLNGPSARVSCYIMAVMGLFAMT